MSGPRRVFVSHTWTGNGDHLREDGHELLDLKREAGKIELPGLRPCVEQQVEVAVVIDIASGDRPEHANIAHAVPATYLSSP